MKLYDFPLSPYCQKVRLVLTEKDLAYDKVFVDLTKNEQRKPEFQRLNPYSKVPVLDDDGEIVYDSTFINEYLVVRQVLFGQGEADFLAVRAQGEIVQFHSAVLLSEAVVV